MKRNNGFTLVELIVVIVILAILVGVTIGGIYMYVGKARVNTDINNAVTMEETMSLIQTDEDLYKASLGMDTNELYTISWSGGEDYTKAGNIVLQLDTSTGKIDDKDGGLIAVDSTSTERKDIINAFANKVFTNGLPDSKIGGTFYLVVSVTDSSITSNVFLNDESGNQVYPESSDDDNNSSSSTATPEYGLAIEYDGSAYDAVYISADSAKQAYMNEHYERHVEEVGIGMFNVYYRFKE